MNTITVRYRDVPWEEILPFHVDMVDERIDWERDLRGKEVQIRVPALPDTDYCGGPWFTIVKGPMEGPVFICPHLAEIGD